MQFGEKVMRFDVAAHNTKGRHIEGLASAYPLDLGGDVIEPGAWKWWLGEWKRSQHIVPLLDHHGRGGLDRVLGHLVEAKETAEGLWTVFTMADTAEGERATKLLNGGHVDGLSIGYMILDERRPTAAEAARGIVRVLLELGLAEVSVVTFPMQTLSRVSRAKPPKQTEEDGDVRRVQSRIAGVMAAHEAAERARAKELLERIGPVIAAGRATLDAHEIEHAAERELNALRRLNL